MEGKAEEEEPSEDRRCIRPLQEEERGRGEITRRWSAGLDGIADVALADFDRAIEIDPTLSKAHFDRGVTHQELKEFEKALRDYTRAITLDEDNVLAYNNRAVVHLLIGQHERAIRDWEEALEIEPEFASARMNLRILARKLRRT